MKQKEVLESLKRLVHNLGIQHLVTVENKQIEHPTFQIARDNCLVYEGTKRLFDIADIKSMDYDMADEDSSCQPVKRIIIERVNGDKLYIVWQMKQKEIYLEKSGTDYRIQDEELRKYLELYHSDRLVMFSVQQSMVKIDFGNMIHVSEEEYVNMLRILNKVALKFIELTQNRPLLFCYCDLAVLNEEKHGFFSEETAFSMLKKYNAEEEYIIYFEEEWDSILEDEALQSKKMFLIEKLLCEEENK